MRALLLTSLFALAACGGSTGSVSLAARATDATTALLTQTQANADLSLGRVRLLIAEAELHGGGCRASFCARGRVEQGPFIATLTGEQAASGATTDVLMADVPAGRYHEAELELESLHRDHRGCHHRAPDTLGAEFADFQKTGATVIVDGAFQGQAFTWSGAIDAEQETKGPITVEAGKSVSLGLVVDAASWFVDASGAPLDPRSAESQAVIAANVKKSLSIEDDTDRRPRH